MTTPFYKQEILLRVICAILFILIIPACSIQNIIGTPEALFPIATLIPTVSSFDAITEFPEDKFLFIAMYNGISCSDGCNCPVSETIISPFYFIDGTLYIRRMFLDAGGEWEQIRKDSGAIGLYFFYDPNQGVHYSFITSLPFSTMPDSDFIINEINSTGDLSVKTSYGAVLVKAGESISKNQIEFTRNDACQFLHYLEIVNYGFIEDDQVIIDEFQW